MNMIVESAKVGAVMIDSLQFSQSGTLAQAQAFRAEGVKGVYGYLGVINPVRLGFVLQAGLAFMPVTLADHFDGSRAADQLIALGLPQGVTVPLDLEGPSTLKDVQATMAAVHKWCSDLATKRPRDIPGLYVGVPQPCTSIELYSLPPRFYWKGMGSIRDRFNNLSEPTCGWAATQVYDSQTLAGALVDYDMIGRDFRGRLPTWVRSA